MDFLWEKLQDATTLQNTPADALDEYMDDAINKAFTAHSDIFMPAFFLNAEKRRLKQRIHHWLMFEKIRPPFRVIAREYSTTLFVGLLSLQARCDRVDELEDGSRLLIDYKTQPQQIKGWFQQRMESTQLPLYAVFNQEMHYTGIAFAEISAKSTALKGIIAENHLYADDKIGELHPIHRKKNEAGIQNWKTLLGQWESTIIQLSNDFCEGYATVDPINTTVCRTCELQALCRVHAK